MEKCFYRSEKRFKDMIEAGQLNAHLLVYMYKFVNYDQAAFPENKYNPYTNGYNANARVRVDSAWFNADGSIGDTVIVKPLRHRSDLISTKIVNIYPDTMVWMRDFSYSYNEPMMHNENRRQDQGIGLVERPFVMPAITVEIGRAHV